MDKYGKKSSKCQSTVITVFLHEEVHVNVKMTIKILLSGKREIIH